MSTAITRDQVAAMIERDEVTIVEALPARDDEPAHLPGASNLPDTGGAR